MGLGILAGAGGTVWAQLRLRRRVERYLPTQVRAGVATRVRSAGADLRGALEEGREAMAQREAELRAQLHGTAPAGSPAGQPGRDGRTAGGPRLRVVGGATRPVHREATPLGAPSSTPTPTPSTGSGR